MSEARETMRKISDWMENYGWTARWNQKNEEGFNTFHGNTNAKPDVLLSKNGYNILVETKPCEKHKDLLDGVDQVIEYAGEYYTGRTKYTLEKPGEAIQIHGIVLATNYSKNGFLFREEGGLGHIEGTWLAKNKDMIEKPITHSVTRLLWRNWEKGLANKHYQKMRRGEASDTAIMPNKPKVGTLISKTKKTTKQVTDMPYLLLNSNEFVPAGAKTIYAFD